MASESQIEQKAIDAYNSGNFVSAGEILGPLLELRRSALGDNNLDTLRIFDLQASVIWCT